MIDCRRHTDGMLSSQKIIISFLSIKAEVRNDVFCFSSSKVTMNSQEAAGLATREANPVIDGRKANVNLAYLGAKPRVIPTPTGKH